MNKFTVFILFLFTSSLVSQNRLGDVHKDELKRNFLVHRIKNFNDQYNYNDLLPKKGESLKLDIITITDTFGIGKNWTYYKVFNNKFIYEGRRGKRVYEVESFFSHDLPQYYKLSYISLVALNNKGKLIYIGGNFFKSNIASMFSLSLNKPISFFHFLKMKLFNYRINNELI